jgi:ankyrin repeat protein
MSQFTEEETRLNNDLLEAAEDGDMDAIKRLVTNGADVNRGGKYNITPLMYAAIGGHVVIQKQQSSSNSPLTSNCFKLFF